jgi:hypothetical protein
MRAAPIQVPARDGSLVIAGATGALGNEVLRRLVGRFAVTHVLAREPIRAGLRGVAAALVQGDDPAAWPVLAATTGIVLFDPPRLFHDRERALWTPAPEQLPALARWLRQGGVATLAVVLPHAQGRLPEALQRGLASLDEHAVAALGFERLVVVRTARKPRSAAPEGLLARVAHAMLSSLKYMVPQSEQPVRAVKVADFVSQALREAPPGIHIAAPELVWRAAQGDTAQAVHAWLHP